MSYHCVICLFSKRWMSFEMWPINCDWKKSTDTMTFYLILAFWPHKVTWTNNCAAAFMLKSKIFKAVLPRCELWPLLPSVAETTQPTYRRFSTFVNLYRQTVKNSGICWPFKAKIYKKKLSSFHIHFSKCETVFSSQAEILLFMYTALFSAPYITAWMSFKQL